MARQRSAIKRFMFDRSFDDPNRLYMPGEKRRAELEAERAAAEEEKQAAAANKAKAAPEPEKEDKPQPAAPPEPTYSKAELEAAREEGYISGHAAALEEVETAREHYIADALALVGQGIDKLDAQQQDANRETGETAMRLVTAVLHKLVPAHAVSHATENIGAFVKDVLPVVLGEPKLVVRVHNVIVKDVEERLRETFERSGFQGGYTVVADYELQPGDCRLEWAGGGADRSEARIWAEVRDIIAGSFGDFDMDALDQAADEVKAQDEVKTEAQNEAASSESTDESTLEKTDG